MRLSPAQDETLSRLYFFRGVCMMVTHHEPSLLPTRLFFGGLAGSRLRLLIV